MNILVKEPALEALKKVQFDENEGVRIEAVFVGSCAIYVDHHLWIDLKNEDDELYVVEDIPFLISAESKKHLPDKVFVDYSSTLGYKLSSNEETFKYNLRLTRRQASKTI